MVSEWDEGVRLFNAGEYWEAHEALEPPWLVSAGLQKRLYAGVILLAAALHKAHKMNNPRGVDGATMPKLWRTLPFCPMFTRGSRLESSRPKFTQPCKMRR